MGVVRIPFIPSETSWRGGKCTLWPLTHLVMIYVYVRTYYIHTYVPISCQCTVDYMEVIWCRVQVMHPWRTSKMLNLFCPKCEVRAFVTYWVQIVPPLLICCEVNQGDYSMCRIFAYGEPAVLTTTTQIPPFLSDYYWTIPQCQLHYSKAPLYKDHH